MLRRLECSIGKCIDMGRCFYAGTEQNPINIVDLYVLCSFLSENIYMFIVDQHLYKP